MSSIGNNEDGNPLRESVPRQLVFVSAAALALAGVVRWLAPGLCFSYDAANYETATPIYWHCSIVSLVFGVLGLPHVFLKRNRRDIWISGVCYAGLAFSGFAYVLAAAIPRAASIIAAVSVVLVSRYGRFHTLSPDEGHQGEC